MVKQSSELPTYQPPAALKGGGEEGAKGGGVVEAGEKQTKRAWKLEREPGDMT